MSSRAPSPATVRTPSTIVRVTAGARRVSRCSSHGRQRCANLRNDERDSTCRPFAAFAVGLSQRGRRKPGQDLFRAENMVMSFRDKALQLPRARTVSARPVRVAWSFELRESFAELGRNEVPVGRGTSDGGGGSVTKPHVRRANQ